jgi:hypothetical protein
MVFHESAEQKSLMQWVKYNEERIPELKLIYHIPNGGRRDAREAARFKAEGVKAGVPDLCFPVSRGKYNGLYIEMKSKDGKLSDNQKWWIVRLEEQGHKVAVCYSWVEAKEEIERYLSREVLAK